MSTSGPGTMLQIEYHGPLVAPVVPEDSDPSFGLSDLFALKRPKNVLSGAGHLVHNVLTGVALGVGSLFMAPAMGAREDGVRGFVTGVGKGVCAHVRVRARALIRPPVTRLRSPARPATRPTPRSPAARALARAARERRRGHVRGDAGGGCSHRCRAARPRRDQHASPAQRQVARHAVGPSAVQLGLLQPSRRGGQTRGGRRVEAARGQGARRRRAEEEQAGGRGRHRLL